MAAIWALFALMLIMRISAARYYRIDSDETQHMHVVWGWTRGLLQYRDIFDNHAPLFQMLMAPYMALLPEDPMTLIWLRMAMIPFFAVALWATYLIATALFSRRIGLWAAVLTGFMPGFFLCSAEFRTDNLWTDFWLLALAAFVGGRLTLKRSFLTGLLFGAATATSMKTLLLMSCFAGAGMLVLLYRLVAKESFSWKQAGLNVLGGAGGFVIVPGLIAAWFTMKGAAKEMFYCVWQHNLIMHSSQTGAAQWLLPMCAGLAILGGIYFAFSRSDRRANRALVFLAGAIYIVALFTLWPLLEREHYLPFFPLLVLFLTPLIVSAGDFLEHIALRPFPRLKAAAFVLPLVVALYGAYVVRTVGKLKNDHTKGDLLLVKSVLQLTGPNQTVIDKKGETVFRPRAFFYVLEPIVRTAIKIGRIKDDTIEHAIATGARVAISDIRSKDIPEKDKAFLVGNYLDTGVVRVLGKRLPVTSGAPVKFQLLVAEKYALVNAVDGTPLTAGVLDGEPYTGPRQLSTGDHQYEPAVGQPAAAVMLADAVALGYKPVVPVAAPATTGDNGKSDKSPSKLRRGLGKLIQ